MKIKPESKQITQTRKKLQKTLEVEHKHFTTSSLHEMSLKIRALTTRRHAEDDSLNKRNVVVLTDSKNKKILKMQSLLKMD